MLCIQMREVWKKGLRGIDTMATSTINIIIICVMILLLNLINDDNNKKE